MTRLAVGGKFGKPGITGSAEARSGDSREDSAAMPIPVAPRLKKWRRVSSIGSGILFLGDGFVEIQNQAGGGGIGRKVARRQLGVGGRFALMQILFRFRAVRKIIEVILQIVVEHGEFGGRRITRQSEAEAGTQASGGRC